MVKGDLQSMTGFAARRGSGSGHSWVWDLRSVNGRSLDLRLRLPDGIDGIEAMVRRVLQGKVARGNVTLSLRLDRAMGPGAALPDRRRLEAAVASLGAAEAAAEAAGLTLAPVTAADILSLRIMAEGDAADESEPLVEELTRDFGALVDAFLMSRAREGAAIAVMLGQQLDRIAALAGDARAAAEARRPEAEAALKENLARIMAGAHEADPARVAQELALLAVKADVTEEIDRLGAHVAGARALLAEGGTVGRKLDFLMQEFMREANTLCSKSGNVALTRIGLDLKSVIDQMREQVQNVE